jgi:hypothetical protein
VNLWCQLASTSTYVVVKLLNQALSRTVEVLYDELHCLVQQLMVSYLITQDGHRVVPPCDRGWIANFCMTNIIFIFIAVTRCSLKFPQRIVPTRIHF